jgi:DUF1680 family protein
MRGPLVYCFEEADNGARLSALRLPRAAALRSKTEKVEGLGEITVIEADGARVQSGGALYDSVPPMETPAVLRAIPYYAWGNRAEGGMRVWLHEQG